MNRHVYVLAASLLLAAPGIARAQSAAGIDALNADLQAAWSRLQPEMVRAIDREGRASLASLNNTSGNTTVSVRQVIAIRADLAAAPGLTRLSLRQGIGLALPAHGAWRLELEAEVRIKTKILFARPTFTFPVRLIVEDLRVSVDGAFDASDPNRPVLQRLNPPQVQFRLKLRSRNLFYGLLLRLLSPIGNHMAQKAVTQAVSGITPSLGGAQGLPGPVPGDGAPDLQDSGQAAPIQAVVDGITAKIETINMPQGRVVRAIMDTPTRETWLDAYGPQGTGVQGTVVGYHDGGDSPIWTGHMIASQAYRYAVTGDAVALHLVQRGLFGLGTLLDINGGTGLLAREAAPQNSLDGQRIMHEPYKTRVLHGETWVSPVRGHISRDQYLGAFLGYAMARELVPDPAVQAECSARIELMLDYIIAHGWYVDEDRDPLDLTTNGGDFPTFWAGNTQKLTYLLLGEHVHPGRYAAELARAAPLAETAWFSAWTGCFNLDSYYKFNLGHATDLLYFMLETDPARWQAMNRARLIDWRYVGQHQNAHFDLVNVTVDPSLGARKFPEVREALERFLLRPHRDAGPLVVDLSGVTWQTLTLPVITPPGQQASRPATITLPTEPIDIPIRAPAGDFLWQRNPFEPATAGGGDPRTELPGIDLLLPYWMGRYLGVSF